MNQYAHKHVLHTLTHYNPYSLFSIYSIANLLINSAYSCPFTYTFLFLIHFSFIHESHISNANGLHTHVLDTLSCTTIQFYPIIDTYTFSFNYHMHTLSISRTCPYSFSFIPIHIQALSQSFIPIPIDSYIFIHLSPITLVDHTIR